MYIDRNNSKTQPYPPIETVEVIKSIKSKEKDRGWFKKWLKKDEEMRKRRSGISRRANKSIDKKCIPSEVIKEAKKLIKTGRVSSEGIKHGLYDPRKQTLYERTEEVKKLDNALRRIRKIT